MTAGLESGQNLMTSPKPSWRTLPTARRAQPLVHHASLPTSPGRPGFAFRARTHWEGKSGGVSVRDTASDYCGGRLNTVV